MADRKSNRAKAKYYYERLCSLRQISDAAGTTVVNGRKVRRSWIVANVGCSSETLSTNSKMRREIKDWDNHVAQQSGTVSKAVKETGTPALAPSESNVIPFRKRTKRAKVLDGQIRWNTVIDAAGNQHRAPILLDGSRIDENASNWFRHLIVSKGIEPQSVEQSLAILRVFRKFLRKHFIDELDVSDETFVLWQNSMKIRVKAGRVNECLRTIHSYYQYLENTGVLVYWVQIYEGDAFPTAFKPPYVFPITSKQIERRSKHSVVTKGWTTPFHLRDTNSIGRNTPTNSDMKKVHANLRNQKHAIRNSILLSLAEGTGGRISEILQICLSQLPDPARLAEIIEKGLRYEVFVKRKRRKDLMPLVLDKYILIRILNYVEKERKDIVRRYPETAGKSDYLFLGDRGNELKADSVTHLVLELFFGILENAGIHRLRSKFAIDRLEQLITSALERGIDVGPTSNYIESALQILSEELGQASLLSLRPYLPLVFGRQLLTTKTAVLKENERRLVETERLIADQDSRIRKQAAALKVVPSLEEVAELMARDRNLAAAERLEEMAAQLRAEA